MANNCFNQLTITTTGEGESLRQFGECIEQFSTQKNNFLRHFFPDTDVPDSKWYDWMLKNWGTKWIDSFTELDEGDVNRYDATFDSAWGPPDAAIRRLGLRYPLIRFHLFYEEPGMCFTGYLIVRGKHSRSKQMEYAALSYDTNYDILEVEDAEVPDETKHMK